MPPGLLLNPPPPAKVLPNPLLPRDGLNGLFAPALPPIGEAPPPPGFRPGVLRGASGDRLPKGFAPKALLPLGLPPKPPLKLLAPPKELPGGGGCGGMFPKLPRPAGLAAVPFAPLPPLPLFPPRPCRCCCCGCPAGGVLRPKAPGATKLPLPPPRLPAPKPEPLTLPKPLELLEAAFPC